MRLAHEWAYAVECLVQSDAEAELIGPLVDRLDTDITADPLDPGPCPPDDDIHSDRLAQYRLGHAYGSTISLTCDYADQLFVVEPGVGPLLRRRHQQVMGM